MKLFGQYIGAIEALITINVLIFLVANLMPEWAIYNLALMPALVMKEPWTLLTSMFLHLDFYHLVLNMVSLYFFGIYLGQIIGEKNLLLVYFTGGIAGGLLFAATSLFLGIPNDRTAALGASGAIFAIGGALAILRPNIQVFMFPIPFPMPLYIAVFGFMVVMSFLPGIAWQGHFGGLIIGALFGLLHRKKYSVQVYDYYR
jgi:membrane associated rhomboid family serine protease